MAKDKNHIHKLKRLKYKSGNTIFFCSLPDCTFKTNIALALGKRSICWRCGNDFLMSEYSLRLAKPHCDACHQPKNGNHEIIPATNSYPGTTSIESTQPEKDEQMLTLAERIQRIIHKTLTVEEEEL